MGIDDVVGKVERVGDGGNLLGNLARIDIATWETSQEVFKAQQGGASVQGVNTANMGIYTLVNGKAVFDFLGKEGNLFIDEKFREDAYNGILENEFFFPQGAMKQHVLSAILAKQSVTINYSGLKIKTNDCGLSYGYIEVGKKNTPEEEKLFFAIYGTSNIGDGKKVYLLRKNVIKEQLQERKNDFIARACYFDNVQDFGAGDGNVDDYYSAVRGVRLEKVAEGDALQNPARETEQANLDYNSALNVVLKNPVRTEKDAASLLAKVTQFYQKQAKQQ